MLSIPRKKKNYFVATTKSPVSYKTMDMVLQNITLLSDNKGYVASLYLDTNTKSFLDNIDNSIVSDLLENNSVWFENDLCKDDISYMFKQSYCTQRNIFYTRMNDNCMIKLNDEVCSVEDILDVVNQKHFDKKFSTEVTIVHDRLYIQTNKSFNRWIMKEISIIEHPEIITESKEDIESFWGNMVEECDKTLRDRIEKIENSRELLKSLNADIVKTNKMDNCWEDKISKLKHFVQNIIFQ